MLDINNIDSTAVHSVEWRKRRNGRFTASTYGRLIGEKSHEGIFTKGAYSYIEEVAHEIITGEPAKDEFFTKDTDWGNAYEMESIEEICKELGKTVLRNEYDNGTHRLILQGKYFACTPDALLPVNPANLFDSTGQFINVHTLEVKNPRLRFLKYYKCKTPQDLKKVDPDYYWQKIAQLVWCGTLLSYWGCYHPNYNVNKRIIPFKKTELTEDVKKFNATNHFAVIELENILRDQKVIE